MEIDLRWGEVGLQDNRPMRLTGARGVGVTCTAGTVWITQSGVAEDIFLNPGQSFRIGNDALALIESIGGGKVRFEQADTFVLPGVVRDAIRNLRRPRASRRFVRI